MYYNQVNTYIFILIKTYFRKKVAPEYRPAYKAMFSPEMLNKKVFNRELQCDEQIKQTKEPLLGSFSSLIFIKIIFFSIGLNYIIEFQFENLTNPAQYICELCHCKCTSQSILSHILNIQHQKKFLVKIFMFIFLK
jgi:hypothetical protein